MRDTDILIANYQSIIRVLCGQVRSLEADLAEKEQGCYLNKKECFVLNEFIGDHLAEEEFEEYYGKLALDYLLTAWTKVRKEGTIHGGLRKPDPAAPGEH